MHPIILNLFIMNITYTILFAKVCRKWHGMTLWNPQELDEHHNELGTHSYVDILQNHISHSKTNKANVSQPTQNKPQVIRLEMSVPPFFKVSSTR